MTDLFAAEKGAEISGCGRYRYVLWRRWDKARPRLVYIMLNPSTADADHDDATIRVCCGRAYRLGYGGIRVVNLFAYRATDPAELVKLTPAERIGPENDQALQRNLGGDRDMLVAAWGDDGLLPGWRRPRAREVLELVAHDLGYTVHALGLTKSGQPRHPLRISYQTAPFVWMNRARYLEGVRA